jgi:prolyl-tRNA editing enzyme YbaK/EbsC (Cys-tRNA(Pro) deacylase)
VDTLRTADDVKAFLRPFGLVVKELPDDTSTSVLAADALNTTVGSIAKSLLFMVSGRTYEAGSDGAERYAEGDRDRPVLVLASGDKRVDPRRVATLTGAGRARLARPAEVLSVTGFPVGGVPPVAHATRLNVLMDRTLFDYPIVFAAGGAANTIVPIAPGELERISGATTADLVTLEESRPPPV